MQHLEPGLCERTFFRIWYSALLFRSDIEMGRRWPSHRHKCFHRIPGRYYDEELAVPRLTKETYTMHFPDLPNISCSPQCFHDRMERIDRKNYEIIRTHPEIKVLQAPTIRSR